MKKILLIAATHGDERIGLEVAKQLEDRSLGKYFDVLIANPEALKQNKRFIDVDLNRSYPGNINSPKREERLAAENLLIARDYKYVIDIHEASQGKDDFIIIPRDKIGNIFPVYLLGLERILLWPDPFGPLGSILENTIELEFGSKNRDRNKIVKKATRIIFSFIKDINKKMTLKQTHQNLYCVNGLMSVKEWKRAPVKLVDFRKVKIDDENFLPLLTDQYIFKGIKCYKMQEITKHP